MTNVTLLFSFYRSIGNHEITTGGEPTEIVTVMSIFIISDTMYSFIMFVSLGIICQIIAVSGIMGNIVNIVVFFKQGFSESINICLFALAISDLMSLVFIIWSNLCCTPIFRDSGIPFIMNDVQAITGLWPHIVFARITGWITAFVSFERCFCVLLPLKVKRIFTPKKHAAAMLTIYGFNLCAGSLGYLSLGLGWRFYPERNASLVGLIYQMDEFSRNVNDDIICAVSGVFMPVTCFSSVVICTVLLVVKLKQQAAWRNTNVSASQPRYLTNSSKSNAKEQMVAKMVVLLSVIFIVSFLPAVGIFIAVYVEPELNYAGIYRNFFLVSLSVIVITESVNSSINICVYFTMSSKFRKSLKNMFHLLYFESNQS